MNLRKTVTFIAFLNFSYFWVEFHFAHVYNSVALLSDSIDFLEDASVNALILLAIGWSYKRRKQTSYALAFLLLIPGVAFIWNTIHQLTNPNIPVGEGMQSVGFGALLINLTCAFLIARHRKEQGGLAMAAFFSARNDALANLMIIAGGFYTLKNPSIWPDLLIGLLILLLNADAAKTIIASTNTENT